MRQEKYWASKVPLPLALLFVVNVFLIVAFQLLFLYRYPAQPDAAVFARYDAIYEDSTVKNSDSKYYLTASLVETTDGQTHLVVTQAHPIAYNRGKIVYAQPVELPESGENILYVKTGIHTSEFEIKAIPGGMWCVNILYGNTGNIREFYAVYLLLGALLEALELLVIHFIKKNLT